MMTVIWEIIKAVVKLQEQRILKIYSRERRHIGFLSQKLAHKLHLPISFVESLLYSMKERKLVHQLGEYWVAGPEPQW